MSEPTLPPPAALLLAAIRAAGSVAAPRDRAHIRQAADAAAQAGRALLEIRPPGTTLTTLRLGWPDANAPDREQMGAKAPTTLSNVPAVVWALCLKAAWQDPSLPPYPGQPFPARLIEATSAKLGLHADAVSTALRTVLPQHGLLVTADALLHLGPAVAALPGPTIATLRRGHHRLPDLAAPPQAPPARNTGPTTPAHDLTPPGAMAELSSDRLVRAVITALESSPGPLTHQDLPALSDPAIRVRAEQTLEAMGRVLLRTVHGAWITGYPDHVATALSDAGIATLNPTERTVLALVLLHTVALPRAQGRHTHPWWNSSSHPVTLAELARNRALPKTAISQALRTLRAAAMVDTVARGKYIPGPALERLSENRVATLWEDLILAGRPAGHLARAIARRRQADQPTSQQESV